MLLEAEPEAREHKASSEDGEALVSIPQIPREKPRGAVNEGYADDSATDMQTAVEDDEVPEPLPQLGIDGRVYGAGAVPKSVSLADQGMGRSPPRRLPADTPHSFETRSSSPTGSPALLGGSGPPYTAGSAYPPASPSASRFTLGPGAGNPLTLNPAGPAPVPFQRNPESAGAAHSMLLTSSPTAAAAMQPSVVQLQAELVQRSEMVWSRVWSCFLLL